MIASIAEYLASFTDPDDLPGDKRVKCPFCGRYVAAFSFRWRGWPMCSDCEASIDHWVHSEEEKRKFR